MVEKICVIYSHHKLGDLIWQLPYIKAISEHHKLPVDLIVREKTQAKNILLDLEYIKNIFYNNYRKGFGYWIDVLKLSINFHKNKCEISQAEGFIRQILGWREFMRGIYWKEMPGYEQKNYLKATRKIPDFFWTGNTKMNCLKKSIDLDGFPDNCWTSLLYRA